MAGIVTSNTPKGVTLDKEFQNRPGSFFVEEMIIQNQYGKIVDLQPLVSSFSIMEELFSPVVMFSARLRDNINFFEDFAISGQEIISVRLLQTNADNTRQQFVQLSFIVKEYPNYEKTPLSSVQEYDIIAVSDYAYLSLLKRISRSVKGNVIDNILKIFQRDLNIKSFLVSQPCVSSFDGVLVIQTPLKAIEWLRQKAFDADDSPFFIFPQISENFITITSLAKLVAGDIYRTYQYKPRQDSVPGTPNAYEEGMRKIINIQSNIKLDKLKQANEGAFSSKTEITDYAKKSFTQKIFNRDKDKALEKNRLLQNSTFGKSLNFLTNGITSAAEPLTNLPDASRSIISTNTASNSSGAPNSSTLFAESMGRVKSYLANIENMNHQIEIYGDLKLNPGKKIQIEVPKSCDLGEYNKKINNVNDDNDEIDKSLSGIYLVAVCVHTFKDGVYTTKSKIMKD
jgi:hypothetical protein